MSFRRIVVCAIVLASGATMVHAANPLTGDIDKGKEKAATCAACHGQDGNSTNAMYPKLAGQHELYIVEQLKSFKNATRKDPIMLGMASPLSEEDMHDLGAYYASLEPKYGVADDDLVDAGKKLYQQGDGERGIPACMACHSPDGAGNPGGYAHLAGQHADYTEKELKKWHDGETRNDSGNDTIMLEVAQKLDNDDIAAVASYIEGLHLRDPDEQKAEAKAGETEDKADKAADKADESAKDDEDSDNKAADANDKADKKDEADKSDKSDSKDSKDSKDADKKKDEADKSSSKDDKSDKKDDADKSDSSDDDE